MDREEKSKQPITWFVRVRGEIKWGGGGGGGGKINISLVTVISELEKAKCSSNAQV